MTLRLRRSAVEAKAAERGYDPSFIEPCFLRDLGDGWWEVDEKSPHYPHAKAGLGDMVARGLESVGITKERVSRTLGVEDCGCRKRQEALNRLGRKFGIG